MAMVWRIEREIRNVEGFAHVVFMAESGKRISRFHIGLPSYPYKAPDVESETLEDWYRKRFKPLYPEIEVQVYVPDYHGRILRALRTMRLDFIRQRSHFEKR